MSNKNRNNQQRQASDQTANPPVTAPVQAPPPVEPTKTEETTTGASDVVADELTQKTAPEPQTEETQEQAEEVEQIDHQADPEETPVYGDDPLIEDAAEDVTAEEVEEGSLVNKQVSILNDLLDAFKTAVGGHGKTPEDFKEAAKLSSTITKHVITFPKAPVLDALLAFFVAEKEGVCKAETFMKGSTTLNSRDERQVGFLYGLFSDLSHRRIMRINNAEVIQVLQKPEISNYYSRKVAGFKAHG